MLGAYLKWLLRHKGGLLSNSELLVLISIAERSLAYRKRYAYIKRDELRLSKNIISKVQRDLKDKGYLNFRGTKIDGKKGLNRYELVLPDYLKDMFIFKDSK
jgi:hypothetical protein